MAGDSNIEWTEATWNPVTGCDQVSAGCDNCYALRLAGRLKAMGQPRYQQDGDPATSGPGFAVTLHHDLIDVPSRWRRPRVVFVNSMSDMFHPDVPLSFIQDVFAAMEATPRHTYQVLTKRSKRLRQVADKLPWPANVWMGVSVEDSRYRFRIDHLRSTPAKVKFLSLEPLIGDPGEVDLTGIHWGHRRRGVRTRRSDRSSRIG